MQPALSDHIVFACINRYTAALAFADTDCTMTIKCYRTECELVFLPIFLMTCEYFANMTWSNSDAICCDSPDKLKDAGSDCQREADDAASDDNRHRVIWNQAISQNCHCIFHANFAASWTVLVTSASCSNVQQRVEISDCFNC